MHDLRHHILRLAIAGILSPLVGCVVEPGTAETTEEINGPTSPANAFQRQRAVAAPMSSQGPWCTATKIAPHFLLTASHCPFPTGLPIIYYGNTAVGTGAPGSQSALIANRFEPPGVDGLNGDWSDTSGKFADVAVIQVDRDDTWGVAATMEWIYPGADASGQKVGCGNHDGDPNPTGLLLQVPDATSTSDASDGVFRTDTIRVDGGDSGGPFYVHNHVIGVLNGEWFGTATARYTSIDTHLDWILSTIHYHWSGSPSIDRLYYGTNLRTFTTTEQVCQYACEQRSDCQAYNYGVSSQSCTLVGAITGSARSSDRGALHYAGARASRTADVVGYLRGDGYNAVLHKASNGHVHELYFKSGLHWDVGDISVDNAPAPSSKLTAYRRGDGTNAVVYRSGNQLIEIALRSDGWHAGALPIPSGTVPFGDPAAYVRADGVSAVVYRDSASHIIELRRSGLTGTSEWIATDLTATATGAPLASSDPTAFVRSDGDSSVVFRSGSNIYELFMTPNHIWDWGEPSAFAAGALPAVGKPAGYTHHDGTNAIVYRTNTNRIYELWLDGLGWHAGDITGSGPAAAGDPVPYVRTDAIEDVVYRSTANQIWELANVGPWTAFNLTSYGAPSATTDPAPYLRGEGKNAVVFGTAGNHANELSIQLGYGNWTPLDLTQDALESP